MRDKPRKTSSLSSVLKRLRQERGLSTVDIDRQTKDMPEEYRVSQAFAWQIENGSVPSPYKLLSLARVYGVTVGEIFQQALGAAECEICDHKLPENRTERAYTHKLVTVLREGGKSAELVKGMLDFAVREIEAREIKASKTKNPNQPVVLAVA